jgi:hypothetical protein
MPKNPPRGGSQLISQSFPVSVYVYRGTLFDAELDLADKWTPIHQVSSKLSSNDKYSTMGEFVDVLSRDINNWQWMLAKYKPVKVSVAATIDSKHRTASKPKPWICSNVCSDSK